MKIALGVLLAALLGVGGFVGHRFYENHKFVESVRPYLKNSSLRLANALRYELQGSGITYLELFKKLDEDLSETGNNILQVQTVSTAGQKVLAHPVLAYARIAAATHGTRAATHGLRARPRGARPGAPGSCSGTWGTRAETGNCTPSVRRM